MPPRKDRIPVVFDTNLLVAYYLSRRPMSAAAQIYHLWRDRRQLQLIVSDDVVAEYLELVERMGVAEQRIKRLADVLAAYPIVTRVSLGARPTDSRDPDDNLMLATALVGKAKFLITNDKDLLDVPAADKKKFKFRIVTPAEFLAHWEE